MRSVCGNTSWLSALSTLLCNQQTQALLDALGQLVQGQCAMQNDAAAAASPLTLPQHAVAPTFHPFDAALESWTEWSRQFGFQLAAYRIQGTVCNMMLPSET
ncbi:uncharacterized protein LOC126335526 [Schistocerca gregaria]|uniref:uncharacterized protein LOC126335526 n=1 Tax=Schistocerca gregaria TaxID=7010 RepID=UPI00211DE5BD|nr:uncharacterized protein LOC126335526 [Schistocerca gregaria]